MRDVPILEAAPTLLVAIPGIINIITSDLAVAAKRIETDFNGSRFDQTFQTGPKSVQPY